MPGKTTLMDLISGTKRTGCYGGEIFVGDKSLGTNVKSVVAHVECFDFHIEEFTVLENMYYTAMLRVGKWMSHEECLGLCMEIAGILSLTPVLDVIVGSELKKGISGGQKKLLSIANELLAFPTVLCLDEPTSGRNTVSKHSRRCCAYLILSANNSSLAGRTGLHHIFAAGAGPRKPGPQSQQNHHMHYSPALGRDAAGLAVPGFDWQGQHCLRGASDWSGLAPLSHRIRAAPTRRKHHNSGVRGASNEQR
jgi:ABC-type transport system involved in cytochrome c biogenesis ATPase subunit